MIRYFCRECGDEVDASDDVLFCPVHPAAVIESVPVDTDLEPDACEDLDHPHAACYPVGQYPPGAPTRRPHQETTRVYSYSDAVSNHPKEGTGNGKKNPWQRRIRAQLDEAARAKRYWTFEAGEWDYLADQAELEGVKLPDVLRGMALQILDRSTKGAVHIG